MAYSPNNTPVYLAAFDGALAGLYDAQFNDASDYVAMADAYAQAFDTAWGAAGYSQLELASIRTCSLVRWQGQPPAPDGQRYSPAAYGPAALEVLALAQAGNAQVVSEGINPNNNGGGGTTLYTAWADASAAPGAVGTSFGPAIAGAPTIAFTPATGGVKVRATAVLYNSNEAGSTIEIGVIAHQPLVPYANPDYPPAGTAPAVTIPGNESVEISVEFVYGGGGDAPPALVAGTLYDFVVLLRAQTGGGQITWLTQSAVTLTVQDVNVGT